MSKKENYISVSEFAKRAGVSVQAIYKRLNGSLKPFLNDVEGEKRLNIKGLELFNSTLHSTVDSTVETQFDTEILRILEKTINNLEHQLSEKDDQIRQMQKTIDNLQKALDQSQQLQALEQKKTLQIVADTEKEEQKKGWSWPWKK